MHFKIVPKKQGQSWITPPPLHLYTCVGIVVEYHMALDTIPPSTAPPPKAKSILDYARPRLCPTADGKNCVSMKVLCIRVLGVACRFDG